MENLIIEPLLFYEQSGKSGHENFTNEFFDDLVAKSQIDVEENRRTASLFRKQDAVAEKTNKTLKSKKVLKGFLIFFIILGVICSIIGFAVDSNVKLPLIIGGLVVSICCLLFIILKLNKSIKNIEILYKKQKAVANETLSKANEQMRALNELFTENDAISLIEKTIPQLKFDQFYSIELAQDFNKNYQYIDYIDQNRSVIDTLSGRYAENPFLFYRYIDHYIGSKTYHGTLLISWTETMRDSDGRLRTVRRTQTLHASVCKPFPYYAYKTALSYGHQCAPDLNFSRKATDVEELTDKQVERRVKKGEKKLKKRAELAVTEGGHFTEMTNSEFDVLFGALDRDHEVQFRVMFTPLAQINMVKLLRSKSGYGDDFEFIKRGKYNHIISEHAQNWQMHAHPSNYYSYDVDIARKKFIDYNVNYFRSVFFDFAPLLSVPAYHDKPSLTFEPIKDRANYTNYEYEVLSNVIGVEKFMHESSVTEAILKTRFMHSENDTDCVAVTASSYTGENRVDFIPVFGGDGRMHPVPVPWVEYLPVQKTSTIAVKKIGLDRKEFYQKTSEKGFDANINSSPSGYYHGLFAKIIDGVELKSIDGVLEKIKK